MGSFWSHFDPSASRLAFQVLQRSLVVGNGGEREASAGSIGVGDSVFVVSEFGVLLVSQRRRYVRWFCILWVCVWLRRKWMFTCGSGGILFRIRV